MRYPRYAINLLSSCRHLWYVLALMHKPKVYLYGVKADSCDKVTKICQHYKVVVIPLKQELRHMCETCEWHICEYCDQEDVGRSLSPMKVDLPDQMKVQILLFEGADCDQVSGITEAEFPYPLKVIQKTFRNELPHMQIPSIRFIRIGDLFFGYVRGEEEALALEKAVAKYEEMGRNGMPFSSGCELQRIQIPGNRFLGATPKTLSVGINAICGFQIVNSIIGVSIR